MWWAIVGLGLLTMFFYLWGEILFGGDADSEAIEQWEARQEAWRDTIR